MKLKKEFITHDTGSESLLVPTGAAEFSGLVKGNRTFGAILELLKTDTTIEQIVESLMQKYDAPEEVIRGDVVKAVSELRKIGAIDG